MEHSGLIERALREVQCPVERMELVGAFAASTLANVRSTKPFNPMLHESYELTDTGTDGFGFHFIAEQVSHHPPISAFHATSIEPVNDRQSRRPSWQFYGTVAPDLKFTGTRIECKPNAHFTLRLHFHDGRREDEVYTWQAISCLIHNLMGGQLYTSLVGSLRVKCEQSNLLLQLRFRGKKGDRADLFASGEISSSLHPSDSGGDVIRVLYGNWASYLASSPPAPTPKEGAASFAELERIFRRCADNDELEAPVVLFHNHRLLWRASTRPEHALLSYNFPHFTLALNVLPTADNKAQLPATDSRCRQDIRLLEEGDLERAGKEKLRLEEEQRVKEKRRLKEKRSLTPPRWFKALSGPDEFGRQGQYTVLPAEL